jgi:hypothetical protein
MSHCCGSCVASRCIVLTLTTSLSVYALLNIPITAAKNFDAKLCSRMNPRSVRRYIMFAWAQSLRILIEHRPSNEGELDLSVTRVLGESNTGEWIYFNLIVVPST